MSQDQEVAIREPINYVQLLINVSDEELLQRGLEINSVLGQNIPLHMQALLSNASEYAEAMALIGVNNPAQWQSVASGCYQSRIPNTDLYVELEFLPGNDAEAQRLNMTIRGQIDRTYTVEEGLEDEKRAQELQRLRSAIERHAETCNRLLNQLTNGAILRAINQFAAGQGAVGEPQWEAVPEERAQPRMLVLQTRMTSNT